MDKGEKSKNPSPAYTVNFLNKLFFWWLKPLLHRVKSNNFKATDLYDILPDDQSEKLGNRLETTWKEESEIASKDDQKRRSLYKAIWEAFKWYFFQHALYVLILDVIVRPMQPFVISLFVKHFDSASTTSTNYSYTCAAIFVLLLILQTLLKPYVRLQQQENGMRLRIACSSLIYKKIMLLPCLSSSKTTKESIINLLANDVMNFEEFFTYIHYIWIMPLQVVVIICLVYSQVGVVFLVGALLMLVQCVPPQVYCKVSSKFYAKITAWRNERDSLMARAVRNIRATKIYCWEKPIEKLVYLARRYEIDIQKVASYIKGVCMAFWMFSYQTSLFLTILVYVLTENTLSAEKVFSTALYFVVLRETIIVYTKAVTSAAQTNASIKRIEELLLLDEVEPNIALLMLSNDESSISLKDVTASWSEDPIVTTTFKNINLRVPPKKLYVVTGPTGAGKSSLIKLMLGELRPSDGEISVNGSTSYASQKPWIFPGSVRSNLLFSELYEEERYNEIVRICGLDETFDRLPGGDQTLIGSEDTILTDGERARINLARALYKEAEIYLLDEPSPLLDNRMLEHCVNGFLNDKTRVVALDLQSQHLKEADEIVFLNNNEIEFQGAYTSFEESDEYRQLTNIETKNGPTQDRYEGKMVRLSSGLSTADTEVIDKTESEEINKLLSKGKHAHFLYYKYLKAGGTNCLRWISILFFCLTHVISCGCDYWIAYWTHQESRLRDASNMTDDFNGTVTLHDELQVNTTILEGVEAPNYYNLETSLYIYGSLILGTIIVSAIRNIIFFNVCLSANEKIHNDMFTRLIRAPMSFFYNNPTERLVREVSKDIGIMDKNLPRPMLQVFHTGFAVTGATLLLFMVNYWTIFLYSITQLLYFRLNDHYFATVPKIQVLENHAKKYALSHVESSISGLSTIRSCRAQRLVQRSYSTSQDLHTSARSFFIISSIAFDLWLDALCTVFMGLVMFGFTLLGKNSVVDASIELAALELFVLFDAVRLGTKSSAEVASVKPTLSRLFKHTELELETPLEDQVEKKELEFWPNVGEIKFHHLYAKRYDADVPILRDFNLVIEGGSKVVVIDKKDSLIETLFRLASIEGSLTVDGIDTKNISPERLRQAISLISYQEAAYFSDTLRDNLDPCNEFDDAILWSALEAVKLKKVFVSLDHLCNQLSSSQRRLLSLARAMMKKNKILIMDESVDHEDTVTDDLIRQIVRTEFKDCTVVTVTKSSHLVKNSQCDKIVLVSDDGEAVINDCSDGLSH